MLHACHVKLGEKIAVEKLYNLFKRKKKLFDNKTSVLPESSGGG